MASDFDPEALHKKYMAERDKRLRRDGRSQYISMTVGAEFSDLADDPYADPNFTRDPLLEEVDVVVVGGGMTGIVTAARLKEAGVTDVRIIEKGADFGGTWYFNRYPGLRCDTESYIYMPLLEETGYIPTEKYARGQEIFEHIKRIGKHYGLYEKACFQTRVTALAWDETAQRWVIKTDRNDVIRAKFICLGGGKLHRPKLPGIPGIGDFKGRMFHTSRWDYEYTGGDTIGNLTGLADKSVALVGTGATAIQVVPNIARYAKHLYVFQRTPSTVGVRDNRPTDPEWTRNLEPGWQERRIRNFTAWLIGEHQDEDLVADGWTEGARRIGLWSTVADGRQLTADEAQYADYALMEERRARVSAIVHDPATAEALKPWYNYWCKRPAFSDDYLQAFNQPNVTLVDTGGRGLERITENAVEFAGISYEIDCLIFSTGFDAFLQPYETGEFELRGHNGISLAERWADAKTSLHGILVSGFPNMLLTLNTAYTMTPTFNAPHQIDIQAVHIAALIKRCLAEGIRVIEAKPEAEQRWVDHVEESGTDASEFLEECTPGYFNGEGAKVGSAAKQISPFEYEEACREWRETRFAEDLEINYEASPPASHPGLRLAAGARVP